MTENLDTGVGMVMEAIDRLGIADHTYLIYMSDNGGGGGASNRPLGGGKGSLWEGGIRIPLIVRGPGISAGITCDVPVVGQDLFPTFCELAGIADKMPAGIDGGSLVPLWNNRGLGTVRRPAEGLVFHFPHYQGRPENGPQSAIRVGDFKLMKFYETPQVHLFDLSKDPGERHDLADDMPEKTAELQRRLDAYLQAAGARMATFNPQYDPHQPSTSDRGRKGKEKGERGGGRQRKEKKGRRGQHTDNPAARPSGSATRAKVPTPISDFPPPAQAAIRETASTSPVTDKQPNLVVVLIDDLGWNDLGFMGNTFIETPSIDRLAGEGVIFTDAYANAPNCAPTRACLLTGQYPPRHGVYTVGESTRGDPRRNKLVPVENRQFLPTDSVTIAEALKPAGYTTACFGMWNLGRQCEPQSMPLSQGFDVFASPKELGYNEKPSTPTRHAQGGPDLSYFANARARGGYRDPKPGEYLTDRLTDEAVQFIEANRARPFFLYLAHHAVHRPYDPKPDLLAKYESKAAVEEQGDPVYAAMVESVDQSVGRILNTLNELRLDENTVVIFFSDNGGDTGGGIGTNLPLRGGKGMLYEGGIRVPLVVRCPGIAQQGVRCNTPVLGSDLYPTILDLANVTLSPDHVVDGKSLVPLLQGEGTVDRREIYWHFPVYLGRTTPSAAIRQGDFKLIETFEDGRLELFNLKDDLGENHNLTATLPQKSKLLQARLRLWQESIGAPIPTEPNPQYDPNADRRRQGPGQPARNRSRSRSRVLTDC
jgi:arylsulfatase A-like enzyme